MNEPTWDEKWEQIADLSTDFETGVTSVYAKQVEGNWRYAIVHWRHHHPSVICEFQDGAQTYGEDL